MSKKLSKKKELWEIVLPEPFKLDPILKPEDLIQTMANFESVDEMNSFLFECLAPVEKKVIVSASEHDIFTTIDSFKNNYDLFVNLVNDEKKYALVVKDKNENILGRGEITRLGKKLTISEIEEKVNGSLDGFSEKYDKEIKNIEALVFQAQSLRENIIKNQDSKETN